jgi:hypothetical protein
VRGAHHAEEENQYQTQAVECYVCVAAALTILNWYWGPTFWVTVLCSYFSASTIITLLQIVTLHRVFGEMHSATRSMMLLIVNVVQILYMYAAWYYVTTNDPGRDFLMEALYVFATIGHPDKVLYIIIKLQIATNFILLVVFLNHLISRWGIKPGDAKKQDTNV